MIAGKKYNGLNVDIWSSGVILYALVCGYLPFDNNDTQILYKKIMKGDYSIPSFVSNGVSDLIKKILCVNPEKRFTLEQIKAHPCFQLYKGYVNIPKGLIIGYHVIPIDKLVLEKVVQLGYEREEVKLSITTNRHNKITTLYYLLLQKFIKSGHVSNADISSLCFLRRPIKKTESEQKMQELPKSSSMEKRKESTSTNQESGNIAESNVNRILAKHHNKIQTKSKRPDMNKLNNTTMMSYEQNLKEGKPRILMDSTFSKFRNNLVRNQTESNNEEKKRGHTQNKNEWINDTKRIRNESVIVSKNDDNKSNTKKISMPIVERVS